MIFNILKRDLKRKKAMNLILFIFIILTSTFMASSVNNLIVTTSAVDYFIEKANVTDYTILALGEESNDKAIDKWLSKQESITDYLVNKTIIVTKDSLKKENGSKYECIASTAITKVPETYNKVFNLEDESFELKPGEIALPSIEGERNDLQVGDKLTFKVGDVTKKFTIKCFVKDAIFGSSFVGYKQLYVSHEDFEVLIASKDAMIMNLYAIESSDIKTLEKDFVRQSFITVTNLPISTVKMIYIMDMIMAAILIVVSICLILIAFFILRFTIVFTIQEDYKEIGIMKAIGIKMLE